jgi:hypothetical protein
MTKILLALATSAILLTPVYAADAKKEEPQKKEEKAPAKKEKACIDKIKDGKPVVGKDGKPEQICKEVKVHEKLDGHKVPDKK